MPIFQEDLGRGGDVPATKPAIPSRSTSPGSDRNLTRKYSEESIRTDLCEGPIIDTLDMERAASATGHDSHFTFPRERISDRIELMERLKRGESPTWLPNRNLEELLGEVEPTPCTPHPAATPLLLPSPDISDAHQEDTNRLQAGLQIERPRSALHSGDFTEGTRTRAGELGLVSGYPNAHVAEQSAWAGTSPPRSFDPFQLATRYQITDKFEDTITVRSRAPSLSSSYSSSFILKAPTSPLVHSESNEELDLSSHMNPIDIRSSYERHARRQSTPFLPTSSSFSKPLPHLRRDNTYPYQAHQPRRSLTNNQASQLTSSPQTPSYLRSRRPSYTPDSSPLLHASMVGSYEESILRGRMSTTPSKPLDFVAQIGVLGIGKCKPSLRCPAHVTIPFPAVFYSYETTTHGRTGRLEDGPSPYVGQIDLENNLPNLDEARDNKRKKLGTNMARDRSTDREALSGPSTDRPSERELRRSEKQKRRSTSPRAPPGGSYRIPEKGQIQIVIKNPNKTAVKLFLVPYDLAGMEPGTKTFIRQRIYSAGPIVASAISAATPHVEAKAADRSTLRYLVHLHICSPARGRFYLYKSIRLVFANRVPDGKEKLRNEISLPEPRFSIYKPGKDSNFSFTGGAGASLAAEKAYRRRSSGFMLGASNRAYDSNPPYNDFGGGSAFLHGSESRNAPVQAIPFSMHSKTHRTDDDECRDVPILQSPTPSRGSRPVTSSDVRMAMSFDSNSTDIGGYDKLNPGDAGYGGNIFNAFPGKNLVAEGLLAKKLRDLGVGVQHQSEQMDGI